MVAKVRPYPTLTAGNAYPMPIQPDYRISDLVSGKYFRLAFSAIGRTWCETIWFEEFIGTADSINCQLVIVDFSPSFRCKPHSQCSSASSSSLSFCSLQSPQPCCPPRSLNAIMIAVMLLHLWLLHKHLHWLVCVIKCVLDITIN